MQETKSETRKPRPVSDYDVICDIDCPVGRGPCYGPDLCPWPYCPLGIDDDDIEERKSMISEDEQYAREQ